MKNFGSIVLNLLLGDILASISRFQVSKEETVEELYIVSNSLYSGLKREREMTNFTCLTTVKQATYETLFDLVC